MRIRIILPTSILLFSLLACSQEKRFTQPNSGMEPTILEGEKFAVDTKAYRSRVPEHGDVVVFRHQDALILKRVIAIAGDSIEGKNQHILRNGALIQEEYVEHLGLGEISPEFSYLTAFGPVKVPVGDVFVMGDNRDFSNDSRDPNFGTVAVADLRGKAIRIVTSRDPGREGRDIK